MGKYVLIYSGGGGMGADEAQMAAIMEEWGAWYGMMGEAVTDFGDPFGNSKSVSADGVSDGPISSPPATGYSIISADSIDEAVAKCQSHPHIKYGGQVSVYETFSLM